jgi:hypothetical protein
MGSPLDWHIDALLRTLQVCETSRKPDECQLYIAQLTKFSREYAELFPSAQATRQVQGAARYYTLIRAQTCDQIRFDKDRAMLNNVYGPAGAAARLIIRRWFSR